MKVTPPPRILPDVFIFELNLPFTQASKGFILQGLRQSRFSEKTGVWEFLFSADFLIFEYFLVSKFQLFLSFSAYYWHFTLISCCFSLFFACGLSHPWKSWHRLVNMRRSGKLCPFFWNVIQWMELHSMWMLKGLSVIVHSKPNFFQPPDFFAYSEKTSP